MASSELFPRTRFLLEIDGRKYVLRVEDIDVTFTMSFDGMVFDVHVTRDAIEVRMKAGLRRAIELRRFEDTARSLARLLACFVGVPVKVKVSRLLPSFTVKPEEC